MHRIYYEAACAYPLTYVAHPSLYEVRCLSSHPTGNLLIKYHSGSQSSQSTAVTAAVVEEQLLYYLVLFAVTMYTSALKFSHSIEN